MDTLAEVLTRERYDSEATSPDCKWAANERQAQP